MAKIRKDAGWNWRALVPKNWPQLAAWALLAIAGAIGARFGLDAVLPPMPAPVFDLEAYKADDGSYDLGWHKDPDAVKAVQSALPFKVFADTPAGSADDPLPDHVYLWQFYRQADPRGPPIKNQNPVGSCVSFGTNNAIIRSMATDIVLKKARFELKDICEEVTYAGSRVEIGGGRIRGDGSVGAWAAKFVQQYGVIAREVHEVGGKKFDLTKYDPQRCRAWGNSGVPAELETLAREHPVQEIALVKTWADAKRALASGYAIAVCSGQGFSLTRDARGVARAQGTWQHCMCFDGYHTDEAGREYVHVENSWGADTHKGPTGWGEPSTAGFWADSATAERMLRENDSWAFSAVKGFPARNKELDWFVRRPARDEQRYALADSRLTVRPVPSSRYEVLSYASRN